MATVPLTQAQIDALRSGYQSAQNDIKTTGSIQPVKPTVATTANPPVQATKTVTMPGPFINNGSVTAGKTVTVPNPTPAAAPTAPQNATLQGPYLNPNTGQYQQGANVVNGAIQYANNAITTPAGGSPPPVPTPNNNGLYQDPFARSREEIARLAKDRVDKILQAGRTAAGGARTGAKNAYDYTNQIEGDSRALENGAFNETHSVLNGRTSYAQAQLQRNRTIQDTAQDKDYNAQVGLINQKLADLEAAAPGDEQAIIDQLEQIERQTGISVAQLQEQQKSNQANYTGKWLNPATGQYQDTIQKTAQDQEQSNSDRDYALKIRQEHIAEAQDLESRYGVKVTPTDDYSLMLSQISGLKPTAQVQNELTQAWKVIEQLGYVPAYLSELIGVPANTQTQAAKKQAADIAVSKQKAGTAAKNAETNANKPGKPATPTDDDILQFLN